MPLLSTPTFHKIYTQLTLLFHPNIITKKYLHNNNNSFITYFCAPVFQCDVRQSSEMQFCVPGLEERTTTQPHTALAI
jgi:hypothetical protein